MQTQKDDLKSHLRACKEIIHVKNFPTEFKSLICFHALGIYSDRRHLNKQSEIMENMFVQIIWRDRSTVQQRIEHKMCIKSILCILKNRYAKDKAIC